MSVLTPEQQAQEIKFIRTERWPMDPFLPVKRLVRRTKPLSGAELEAEFANNHGFIYRKDLNAGAPVIYLGGISDVAEVQEEHSISDMHLGGKTVQAFSFNPSIKSLPPAEVVAERLRVFKRIAYESLEEMVEEGWVVD